jgi:hypothetical protein
MQPERIDTLNLYANMHAYFSKKNHQNIQSITPFKKSNKYSPNFCDNVRFTKPIGIGWTTPTVCNTPDTEFMEFRELVLFPSSG